MKQAKRSTTLMRQSILAAAASLCMAGVAYAQSAEGSIFGSTKAGATVTILNLDSGTTRSLQAEGSGSFAFSKLPPGRYRITANGVTREISVAIGSGTEVRFEAEQLERIDIVGSRVRSRIDVSTTETNTVFTAQQIQALPVSRNVNSVALLAPGVVKGDSDLGEGGLPAFGGASVAENGYYINGFDVTNIRNFLSYAKLPFDAISQQQIKSGGYGAEYGRSLGGVVSLVTKRGTNEWKGGGAIYYEPNALRSKGQNVLNLDPDVNTDFQHYTIFSQASKRSDLSFNLYGGGPIIKDKLFVFGLIEGVDNTANTFQQGGSVETKSSKPNGMLKLDWNITDNHTLELTAISNKTKVKINDYSSTKPYPTSNVGSAAVSEQTGGGDIFIGKYTGYLTDNLTVSALVGGVNHKQPKTTGARNAGFDCPVILDESTNEVGCWAKPFPGPAVRDPNAPDDGDKRRAARFDVEYSLGDHTIRGGYDGQKFKSTEAGGSTYSGGYYARYFVSTGSVNGVATPAGTKYVRKRVSQTTSGEYEVDNTAMYIEDSWKMNKNWLLYGGLRSESFNNKNSDGQSFVKADNLIAPRLGASWNVNGDSSLKVFTNLGRYYIPVASNTNIRATRAELFTQRFYTYASKDPRTQAPVGLGAEIGVPQVISSGALPDPATIADTQLKPMNQDEFIIGFQQSLSKDWNFGVKYTKRKINDGMDDFCGHYPFDNYANDKGFKDFDNSVLAQCIIVNPGRDVNLKVDWDGSGKLVNTTIPAKYFGLAKYERKYDAVEFSLEKPYDGKWGLNASYTLSKSRGTAEGYVQSNLNQEDAGITQDFDFGSFTHGSNGYLPNDRRHVVKVFGNYAVSDEIRLGVNATLASGRPKSCIGFVPPTVADYAESRNYTSASSYYCAKTPGTSVLVERGSVGRTPWSNSVDFQVAYSPKIALAGKLSLQADIFNVFNTQTVIETNEVRDYARSENGRQNPNYGQPTSFQTPRSIRLTARYEY